MKSTDTLESLPALITQLTADLTECLDCAWTAVLGQRGSGFFPVCIHGYLPDVDRCAAYASSAISERGQIANNLAAFETQLRLQSAPAIICPIPLQRDTLIWAFGPKRTGEAFSPDDRDLIAGVAGHLSFLMSENRLAAVRKRLEQIRRTEVELESARDVQHRFFPLRLPPIDGLDYYGECRPAGEMGGDFFDFIAADSSSLLLSIGDVSGKGVPAAIIMAGLQASLRALSLSGAQRVSSLVRDLNRMVWQVAPDNFFVTLFCARIDCTRGELHYVNAGQEPPLLIRSDGDTVVRLDSTGAVLGLSTRSAYEQRTVHLGHGDVLVAATDGVTEALYNAGGTDAHKRAVLDAVRDHPDAPSSDLAASIIRAAQNLAPEPAPPDDQTVVVAKFLAQPVKALASAHARSHDFSYAVPAAC